ncbi:hypothetical protein [Clostridium sp.]|uniref:hypothetical protein n=1 Tax=Clostridium sp. TaxID=1506 RepID=UPI002FC86FF8
MSRADFSSRDNYGNKIDVITYNLEKQKYLILKGDKAVTIRATPYLISDITDKKTLGIVYDNFRVEYQINLNDLYTANKIKVFEIYKYLVGTDDITINFSIVSPSINISSLICKYKLHSINDNFNSTCEITSYTEIPSINLLGQNILNIRFDTKFKKEEIYLFEVAFFTKDDTGSENLIFKTAQFLVTSEVFNKFYSSKKTFQDISLTE